MKNLQRSIQLLFISVFILLTSTIKASTFYWVGGTGNWSDYPAHWATTSGGSVFHVHPPTILDDVIFNDNSFINPIDSVIIDINSINCKTMDWSAVSGQSVFTQSTWAEMNIYGSVILSSTMQWRLNSTLNFKSNTPGNVIDFAGKMMFEVSFFPGTGLINNLMFLDTGYWNILGPILLTDTSTIDVSMQGGRIQIGKGHIQTNGYPIFCREFYVNGDTDDVTLDLDTTVIIALDNYEESNFNIQPSNINASNARIYSTTISIESINDYQYLNCTNCLTSGGTADTIICRETIHGSGNIIYCNMMGNLITANSSISRMDVSNSNVSIHGHPVIDELNFLNPGQTIELRNVLTVNDKLTINSATGLFTTIESPNSNGSLIINGDTVCTDNLMLHNVPASGNAVLYAGDHSLDLGGNSGWNFSSCIPTTTNVWPGDVNNDLITDNTDILFLSLALGDTGITRSGATINYTAQPCLDWPSQFANGVNAKHADCDGNGIVELTDTAAISLNYSQTHLPRLINNPIQLNDFTPPFYLNNPSSAPLPGSMVSIPVMLGTTGNNANGFHGIAFSIFYDPQMVVAGSVSLSLDSGWLADGTNGLSFIKEIPSANKIDAAITRTDRTDESGAGRIGMLNFMLSPNAIGNISFSIINSLAINYSGIEISVLTNNTSTDVGSITTENSSKAFPNPFSEKTQISFANEKQSPFTFSLFDPQSRLLLQQNFTNGNLIEFQRKNLKAGIYFYKIISSHEKELGFGKLIVN